MTNAKGLSEYKCTCHCGGAMFYAHLHADDCSLSMHGEKAPSTQEARLRAENAALAARLEVSNENVKTVYLHLMQAWHERDEWMKKCEAARAYADTLIETNNRLKIKVFRLENELADALEGP